MSETGNRSVRTAVQTGFAGVTTEFVDAFLYDMTDRQYGALVALLVVAYAFVQNLVETRTGTGLLRNDLS